MPVPNVRSDYAGGQSTTFADSGAQVAKPFSVVDQLKALMGAEQKALASPRRVAQRAVSTSVGGGARGFAGTAPVLREGAAASPDYSGAPMAQATYGKEVGMDGMPQTIGGIIRIPEREPGAVFTGYNW